jgi:hypothetical protein
VSGPLIYTPTTRTYARMHARCKGSFEYVKVRMCVYMHCIFMRAWFCLKITGRMRTIENDEDFSSCVQTSARVLVCGREFAHAVR